MTDNYVSATIYGQRELIPAELLPYVSALALTSESSGAGKGQMRAELNNAEQRYLLRIMPPRVYSQHLLQFREFYTSTDELTFELGWLSCEYNLFTPDGF